MPGVPVRLKYLKPKPFPDSPHTLGEHLKKRRLELGLTQVQVSERLHISSATVLNWEADRTPPAVGHGPAILAFLGYDPAPEPETLTERMRALRRANGWTIARAARHLKVDPGTWGEWERTGRIAWPRYRSLVEVFLKAVDI